MKFWISHEECDASGLCETIAPEMFWRDEDGIAYVVSDGHPVMDDSESIRTVVPSDKEEVVREAAEGCPGRCIIIED